MISADLSEFRGVKGFALWTGSKSEIAGRLYEGQRGIDLQDGFLVYTLESCTSNGCINFEGRGLYELSHQQTGEKPLRGSGNRKEGGRREGRRRDSGDKREMVEDGIGAGVTV